MSTNSGTITQNSIYVVQQGDTLSALALQAYGNNSPSCCLAISQANPGLDLTKLTAGEQLILPLMAATPKLDTLYTVKSNDTLQSISQQIYGKYSPDYSQSIYSNNQATVDAGLAVGEVIFLPPPPNAMDLPLGAVAHDS